MVQTIVIGGGVSGLTSAIRLLENGFEVTIVTREHPQETTSAVAAAIWSGHGNNPTNQRWSRASLHVFNQMAQDESTGVVIARFRDIYPHTVPAPWYKNDLDFCEKISLEKLPDGYVDGYLMEIPLIQTPLYMTYLLDRFHQLGGELAYRTIESISDLYGEAPLLINCSGVWARYLADDERVHPLWGQVLLVHAPYLKELLMDDVAFTYIFPRRDGCVLGGVAIPDRWEREADPDVTEDILSRCEKLIPGIRDAEILSQKVGLRPGRDQVRLEREDVDGHVIIHNYGHGSVGFTLSWGCAEDVLLLAQGAVSDKSDVIGAS